MTRMHRLRSLGLEGIFNSLNFFTSKVRIPFLIKLKIAVGLAFLGSKFGNSQTVEFPNNTNQSDTLKLNVVLQESVSCYVSVVTIEKYSEYGIYNIQEQNSLDKFVKENVLYPDSALNNRIEGDVAVNVNLNEQGKIIFAEVLSKKGYGLDEEALRLVSILPALKPEGPGLIRSTKNRTIVIHFELPK